MNDRNDQRWETELDRELKALPELPAPDTLLPRVMAALRPPTQARWQSWSTWPAGLRAVSLVLLMAFFGGLCFAGWQFSRTESVTATTQTMGSWFSWWKTLWSAVNTLAAALITVANTLGKGFIIAALAVAALSYAACIGLGTVFVRLISARRWN